MALLFQDGTHPEVGLWEVQGSPTAHPGTSLNGGKAARVLKERGWPALLTAHPALTRPGCPMEPISQRLPEAQEGAPTLAQKPVPGNTPNHSC